MLDECQDRHKQIGEVAEMSECGNCKFWNETKDIESGFRYPPHLPCGECRRTNYDINRQTKTSPDYGCVHQEEK